MVTSMRWTSWIMVLFLGVACAPPEVAFVVPALEGIEDELLLELARPVHAKALAVPANALALGSLAQVFEVAAAWPAATDLYLRAAELEPDKEAWTYHAALCLQLGGKMERGAEYLIEHASRFPRSAAIQTRLGETLLDLDQLEAARAAFTKARTATSNSAPILGLAEVDLAAGRPERAAELAQPITRREPSNARAWFLYGRALREQGQLEAATPALERGIGGRRRALPDAWTRHAHRYVLGLDLFFGLDRDLERTNRIPERLGHLEAGREEFPTNERIAVNLAVVYMRLNRLPEARNELARALELAPESAELNLAFASLHITESRPELALEAARRATALEPGNVGAQLLRARYALALRLHEEVREASDCALAIDAGNLMALETAVAASLKLHDLEGAVGHLQQQVLRAPHKWRPWVQLALALRATGDPAGAEAARERAVSIAPDEPAVRALRKRSDR